MLQHNLDYSVKQSTNILSVYLSIGSPIWRTYVVKRIYLDESNYCITNDNKKIVGSSWICSWTKTWCHTQSMHGNSQDRNHQTTGIKVKRSHYQYSHHLKWMCSTVPSSGMHLLCQKEVLEIIQKLTAS